MTELTRTSLGRADAGVALAALASWTTADLGASCLHPGDVGWFLRFEEETVAKALTVWSDGDGPVAVELFDPPVRRVNLAPRACVDPGLTDALARALFADRVEWLDLPDSLVRDAAIAVGYTEDPDGTAVMIRSLAEPVAVDGDYTVVGEDAAADRVAVQFAAFTGSTFSVARWRQMKASPAGQDSVCVLVRTPDGTPAAAATGWFAGPGRCGLLEPVGTHPDLRRQGYGRTAVLGTLHELRERGASAVAVMPPADNEAAVALYISAGMPITTIARALRLAP